MGTEPVTALPDTERSSTAGPLQLTNWYSPYHPCVADGPYSGPQTPGQGVGLVLAFLIIVSTGEIGPFVMNAYERTD